MLRTKIVVLSLVCVLVFSSPVLATLSRVDNHYRSFFGEPAFDEYIDWPDATFQGGDSSHLRPVIFGHIMNLDHAYVATYDGQIIGSFSLFPYRENKPDNELFYDLYNLDTEKTLVFQIIAFATPDESGPSSHKTLCVFRSLGGDGSKISSAGTNICHSTFKDEVTVFLEPKEVGDGSYSFYDQDGQHITDVRYDWSGALIRVAGLPNGDYTWTVKEFDADGNFVATDDFSFNIWDSELSQPKACPRFSANFYGDRITWDNEVVLNGEVNVQAAYLYNWTTGQWLCPLKGSGCDWSVDISQELVNSNDSLIVFGSCLSPNDPTKTDWDTFWAPVL